MLEHEFMYAMIPLYLIFFCTFMVVQMLQNSTPRNQFNLNMCSIKMFMQPQMNGWNLMSQKNSTNKKHSTYNKWSSFKKHIQPLKNIQHIKNVVQSIKNLSIFKRYSTFEKYLTYKKNFSHLTHKNIQPIKHLSSYKSH